MRRMRMAVLIATFAAMLLAFPAMAFADSLSGGDGWEVTYTSSGTMEDNYSAQTYIDQVGGLQPGDDITFKVALHHENEQDAAWYVTNDVVKSLEEGAASGSAYGYVLSYEGPSNSRTLYDSQAVGGDDTSGLIEATNALDDYIFLGNMSEGDEGTVTLVVTLDGETEGNAYFDTLARLNLAFAVEPVEDADVPPTTPTNPPNTPVKTGDETNLFPFYVTMVVSGLLLLAIAIVMVRNRRRDAAQGTGAHGR